MRFRNNIILLIILAALGGYVYYTEFRNKDEERKLEDAKRKVFQFEGKDVSEIKITQDGKTIAGVRKNEKDWSIAEPPGLEADSGEWETLASHIAGLEKERVVNENATDLAPFGLAAPLVQLSVKRMDGQSVDILLGDENPKKTLRYAKISTSPEVFLSPNMISNFRKSLTDLRNKTIIEMLPDEVDRFVIVDGGKKTSFRKAGEDWLLDAPTEGKADSNEVTALLSAIQFLRATDFADDATDPRKTGLDASALQLTMHDTKTQKDRTLLVGKEKEPGKFFARDASRPVVFIIDKQAPDKLRQPQSAWRDKTIAKVDRDKIDEIEITKGTEKIALKKSESDWKLADGKKASSDAVLGLMDVLDFERAREIVDSPKAPASYGLDKPRVQVSLRQGGKDAARLTFGSDSVKPDGVYMKRTEGTILVVSKELMNRYMVSASDLEEKPVPPLPSLPSVPPK
jgi:hypothetical protein